MKKMPKLNVAPRFAAAFIAGIALAASAQARDLTVVSWGGAYQDAQKKVYFEPFKKVAGVLMNDESWDGGIGVLRAKVQGGAATWDVVQVESEELAVGCEEGLFEKIDYSKIGGEAAYLPPSVNPCGVGAIL
jgi:putative spermidine/putrescine transport system substrate-binding protein